MKTFRRIIIVCFSVMLCFGLFTACGTDGEGGQNQNNYSVFTLDEMAIEFVFINPGSSGYSPVKDAFGSTVSIDLEKKIIKFSGLTNGGFGEVSYTVDENGKVTFDLSSLQNPFKNASLTGGIFRFDTDFGGSRVSLSYFCDAIIEASTETYELSYVLGLSSSPSNGDPKFDSIRLKAGEPLVFPTPENPPRGPAGQLKFMRWGHGSKDGGGYTTLLYRRMPAEDLVLRAVWDF